MEIINELKHFVENECKKPTNKYGYEPFSAHFIPMVNYAEKLADELGGDKEVILIAAWLHDIGSIIHGRKDHHITSAKIAEEKLTELQYPVEKIELNDILSTLKCGVSIGCSIEIQYCDELPDF